MLTPQRKQFLLNLPFAHALEYYAETLNDEFKVGAEAYDAAVKRIAENDLFFLLYEVLNRADMKHPWVYERCREVQASPNDNLDLWARFHYKSTIITFGKTFDDIIHDQEITVGLFSHTRPLAKQFLRQIMFEMERNKKLSHLWPDIFWEDPRNDAPKWSEDDGIIVKRKSNPKEATVEAWGLIDGQPISKHFKLRVYDDIVTESSVSTPEQIQKTTKSWELSSNLGTLEGGMVRYAGTRYHLFDTYSEIVKRKAAIARVHAATDNGKEDGKPVLLTEAALKIKRTEQGPYTFASQMLLNPVADKVMGFKLEWVDNRRTISRTNAQRQLNIYLLCDPASEKRRKARKDPDFTSMWVFGVSATKKHYLLDGVRDRLNLGQRASSLIGLHRKWRPKAVGYEQYGMQADIEHIKTVQENELYEFEITELGGSLAKNDRIKRLIPVFEAGRWILPNGIIYKDHTGATLDLVKVFLEEEYQAFPVMAHDDMFDCLARSEDTELGVVYPDPDRPVEDVGFDYGAHEEQRQEVDWQTS